MRILVIHLTHPYMLSKFVPTTRLEFELHDEGDYFEIRDGIYYLYFEKDTERFTFPATSVVATHFTKSDD